MWYKIANIESVQPEPGTATIPSGMVRRFHVTQAAPEVIRSQGLLQSAAKGIEGPKAIYSWPEYGDAKSYAKGRAPIVEFYTDPKKLAGPYHQFGDIPANQIIAIHESWHDKFRYAIEGKIPVQEMIDTKDSDYIRAAEEMKKMGLP